MLRLTICLILLLTSISAYGDVIQLTLSPQSCVIKNGQCQTQLIVNWHTPEITRVCLHISVVPEYNRCFNQQSTIELAITSRNNVTVKLSDQETGAIIAMSQLSVFIEEFKSRRRKRNAWSWLQ